MTIESMFDNLGIRRLLNRLGVDFAVIFGLLARIWGVVAGPVSAILIAAYFTPQIQGYYYTFASILAIQVFVELGLGTVIVQFASHEWAKLSLDESGHIVGNQDSLSRLISIANIVAKWYLVGGIIVTIGAGAGGYMFFSNSPSYDINWLLPWCLLCFVTGMTVWLVPIWSLLEGCNQVTRLYEFRFYQGLFTTIATWLAILSGAELWTAAISTIVSLICSGFFLKRSYWIFITTLLLSAPGGAKIIWQVDILPMQWRMAISWICGYFIYSLFVPVLFKFHGPIVAGQMGMTWSLVGLVGVATSYLLPKVPQLGMLVAQRQFNDLDALFWKITKVFSVLTILAASMLYILVLLLNVLNFSLANRLLPLLPTGIFILAQLFMYISMPFSYYMFAHKENPLMLLTIVNAVFSSVLTVLLGKYRDVVWVAFGFLFIQSLMIPCIFLIWRRSRIAWHGEQGQTAAKGRT